MDRNDLFIMIPEPKNSDVIVYDTTLTFLLDVDVFENYNKDLAEYKIKKENFNLLNQEIKNYIETIDNIYLFNNKWNEADYLEMLKKEKINYSSFYSEIKKIENNIEILEKKIKNINEKIEIQRINDIKEIEDKKANINEEIKNNEIELQELKEKLSDYKLKNEEIKSKIDQNIEEQELIKSMQASIDKNEYKCKYCGTVITNGNTKNKVFNILQKDLDKIDKIIQKLQDDSLKNENFIQYYKNEIAKCKENLKNNIEFKKQDYTFYIKKSVKILELEAQRDNFIKNITSLREEYNNSKKIKEPMYIQIKDRISKYEVSIENLRKLKEYKQNFNDKKIILNKLKEEIEILEKNLTNYKKFLQIYFKIYEQKANDYFGKDFKFKIFKFNEFELVEIFEVYYKDMEYSKLNQFYKRQCDKIYQEKLSSFL